jgi:NitT/TauT family transport system ATP-binding protein
MPATAGGTRAIPRPVGERADVRPLPADTSVRIEGLHKVFLNSRSQPVEALQGIDLEVKAGEVVAIIGPSGCGKSSLLRILAGLDTDYEGDVRWNLSESGASAGGGAHRLRSAAVFQGDSTLPWMTVADNIAIGLSHLRLPRQEIDQRVTEVLRLVGLSEFITAYPHELSGGMRQRVAIARALATKPHLLLMDEPLSALDAQTRLVMQQELLNIWATTKSTVVYVTHDIEEAVVVADRIVVLSSRPGRISLTRTVDVGRLSVTEQRRSPAFGNLVVDLWNSIDHPGDAPVSHRTESGIPA